MWPIKKAARKTTMLAVVAILCISLLAACNKGTTAETKNDETKDTSPVVAEYKGGTITENEFNHEVSMMKFFSPQYAQMFDMDEYKEILLEQEIAYKSLDDSASEAAKTAGAKQGEEQLAQFKTSVDPEQLATMLKEANLTEQDVKDYMTRVLTASEVMKEKVTDADVEKYYNDNKKDYTTASVRHVLIGLQTADGKTRTDAEALKLAKEVKAKLDGGADFATIAKKYSDDTGSKDKGGLYENYKVGNWVEGFKNAALEQKIGVIGDPVKTDYGYHVIKVESRTDKAFADLTAEEKETIKSQIASQKFSEYMSKEVPGMITKKNLPKSETAPAATAPTEGTTAPTAPATEGTTAPTTTAPATEGTSTEAPAESSK